MKILVTGVAGFIGSHVAARLISRGDQVVGVDNLCDYYEPILKRENVARLRRLDSARGNEGFLFEEADIRDQARMQSLFESHSFQAIIHLAAMPGVRNSIRFPELYLDVNLNGTALLLDWATATNVGHFVFASTSSIYGATVTIPFVEDDPGIRPSRPYAESKLRAEEVGRNHHRQSGLNFSALRLFSVYGPYGRPDMMPLRLLNSIRSGEQIELYEGAFQRDWTYIDDVVDGILLATSCPAGFEIYNLGRGEAESLQSFVQLVQDAARGTANLKLVSAPESEMEITFADISKARKRLGFEPKISVELGVQRLCDWFQQHSTVTKDRLTS